MLKYAVIETADTVTLQDLEAALAPLNATILASTHDSVTAPPPPPPPPPEPTSTQLLALTMDDLVDHSPFNRPVTIHGDAVLDTTMSKFGASSMKLIAPGNTANMNGYIEVPDSDDWAFAADTEITIHAWVRPSSIGGAFSSQDIVGHNQSSVARSWFFRINDSGTLAFDAYQDDLTNVVEMISTEKFGIDWSLNVWVHVAVTRDAAGVWRMFKDGIQTGGESVYNGAIRNLAGRPFRIGANSGYPAQSGFLTGHIDEVEIVVGEARWTANFTPPTTGIVGA